MPTSSQNKDYYKKYYWKNRKKILARKLAFRKANPDYDKNQYRKHRKKIRLRYSRYYKINKDNINKKKRIYRSKYPETVIEVRMKKYGITLKEYRIMFFKQNKRCGVCGRKQRPKERMFDIDHDHKTRKVRGIICNCCNFLLGYAKDNTDILHKAIRYLEKHR
jgi:hypothetical protein